MEILYAIAGLFLLLLVGMIGRYRTAKAKKTKAHWSPDMDQQKKVNVTNNEMGGLNR